MSGWVERWRWFLCCMTGTLLILGNGPFGFPEAGWVALVPVWFLMRRSDSVAHRPFRYGYVAGLVWCAGSFWWIENVTAVGMVFMVFYLAFYPAFWLLFVSRVLLAEKSETLPLTVIKNAVAASCFWVALEWVRSWMITGFSWDQLGTSQAESLDFRQLAAIGGVPLISFFLVIVNVFWAEGWLELEAGWLARKQATTREILDRTQALELRMVTRLPRSLAMGVAFMLAVHLGSLLYLNRHDGEMAVGHVTYACIQPNIPQIRATTEEQWEAQTKQALSVELRLSLEAAKSNPQLMVWPESVVGVEVFTDREYADTVQAVLAQYRGNLLIGSNESVYGRVDAQGKVLERRKLYNSAFMFWKHDDRITFQAYRKNYLVLIGEYLPYGDTFPWLRNLVGIGEDFQRGTRPEVFDLLGSNLTVSPLICFEDTVPEVVEPVGAGVAGRKPNLLVTISDDGWYTGWTGYWGVTQHLNNAIFRCVEQDLPMLRCGNNGISCFVDANGTVLNKYADSSGKFCDVEGILTGDATCYPCHGTLYMAGGRQMVLIFTLTTTIILARFAWKHRIASRNSQ